MKRTTLIAAATLALAGGIASAQENPPARPAPGGDRMFKEMDTDGDGKVSATEHSAAAARMFATMDGNGDGTVPAEEMTAARQKIVGAPPAPGEMSAIEKIKVIDSDGDGVLTAEEHSAGSKAMFERMDTDKDGFVTRAEMAAGQAMRMRKYGGHRP
jgi:Ca2+-binding EF-hand superfamily protein